MATLPKLANGARIITLAVNVKADGSLDGFVLAEWRTDPAEFVTWRCQALPADTELHCFNGHYFQDSVSASADFANRTAGL